MLVGAEPKGLHGGHPELAGAAHVLIEPVSDEVGVRCSDVERLQRPL